MKFPKALRAILLACAVLCSATLAHAQGGGLGSYSSPVINNLGRPIPGASIAICSPLATTGASVASNVATLTMASNPQTAGFVSGMQMIVSGFSGSDVYFNVGSLLNGQFTSSVTILSVTSTTITYTLVHANGTATSNGTAVQQGNSVTSCAGLATITSDPALQNTISQPLISDYLGNWSAFAAPNVYYVQFYGPGLTTTVRQATISCVPFTVVTCGVGPGGSNTQVEFNDSGNLNGAADLTYNKATGETDFVTPTPATGGANQSSPKHCSVSNYWTGAASAADSLCWQAVPGSGANPNISLFLTHSGSSGNLVVDFTPFTFFKTGPLQIVNGVNSQLLQTGSNAGPSWQFPLTGPANPNMFLMGFGGSPNQLAWKNAPWSTAPVDLTGQNAGIGTTVWASSNLIDGAGQYRITWDAKVTTAAGTSSTLGPLTITYVDPDGTTQTITAAALSKAGVIETSDTGNSTTTVLLGVPILLNSNNAANNFTYAFGYASNAANAMVYNLHLRLEAIQ